MNSRRIYSVSPASRPAKKRRHFALLSAVLLGFLCSGVKGALIGDYQFRGNFNNSVTGPGSLPAMTAVSPGASGFSADGWYWNHSGTASGLKLGLPSSPSSFSIGISFSYSEVTGYGKVIDFSKLGSDSGLYVQNNQVVLYNSGALTGGSAFANTPISIILTRSDLGQIEIYQKGALTPIISFSDSGDVFALLDELNFFLDDSETSGNEYLKAGSVSQIRIWNTALSSEEVAVAFEAIPEPSLLYLMAGAGVVVLCFRSALRRRRLPGPATS